MSFENIGAEEFEVAAQTENEETGVEEQETAEPVSEQETEEEVSDDGKTSADAAFAEMRRAKEAAEKELEDLRAEQAKQAALQAAEDEAIAEMSGYDDVAYLIAEASGKSIEEVNAEIEAERERAELRQENETLRERLSEVTADKLMADDLAEIQRFDPNVKDLSDLGESYEKFRLDAGLSAQQAYFALKAEKEATQIKPAKPIGQVNPAPVEKDYFTESEVNAMTSAEKSENWEKIMASLPRWKK